MASENKYPSHATMLKTSIEFVQEGTPDDASPVDEVKYLSQSIKDGSFEKGTWININKYIDLDSKLSEYHKDMEECKNTINEIISLIFAKKLYGKELFNSFGEDILKNMSTEDISKMEKQYNAIELESRSFEKAENFWTIYQKIVKIAQKNNKLTAFIRVDKGIIIKLLTALEWVEDIDKRLNILLQQIEPMGLNTNPEKSCVLMPLWCSIDIDILGKLSKEHLWDTNILNKFKALNAHTHKHLHTMFPNKIPASIEPEWINIFDNISDIYQKHFVSLDDKYKCGSEWLELYDELDEKNLEQVTNRTTLDHLRALINNPALQIDGNNISDDQLQKWLSNQDLIDAVI